MRFGMEEKEFLTSEDIARALGYHIQTVRRYLREGIIPAIRLKGEYRVRREDFERFLEERKLAHAPIPPFLRKRATELRRPKGEENQNA